MDAPLSYRPSLYTCHCFIAGLKGLGRGSHAGPVRIGNVTHNTDFFVRIVHVFTRDIFSHYKARSKLFLYV